MFTIQETEWRLALEILLKLGVGAVLGGAIGYEREKVGRPAGIRTHMLLVIGVTLIAEVSKAFGGEDQSRIAAQIVSGVGFLGAGTILRTGLEVKGLTTAASLWAAAAIGLAVSTGGIFLVIAVAATLLTLFTLSIVDRIERALVPNAHPKDLLVRLSRRDAISDLLNKLDASGYSVRAVKIEGEGKDIQCRLSIQGDPEKVMAQVSANSEVLETEWAD